MAISTIRSFRINNKEIVQTIDTSTDAVYFTVEGKDVFHVNSMGYCTDGKNPKYLGKFSLIGFVWIYSFFNDNFKSITECDKITTTVYNLIDAEMCVVKELIKQNVLEV